MARIVLYFNRNPEIIAQIMNRDPCDDATAEQQRRDRAVDRLRQALRREVRASHLTQRAIEEENGFTRGYLSQVLQGHVTLTVRHVFGILFALGISPDVFFHQLFASPVPAAAGPLSEIRERMARYDAALKELEEKGVLAPGKESGS